MQPPVRACGCRWHVSFRARDEMRAAGEVFVIVRDTAPDWREVIVRRKMARVPKAQTVTAWDILTACSGSRYQIERIECFGELAAAALVELGALLRARAVG